jgi:hypothetical protein
MLTSLEKQSVLASLRNGLGFTRACSVINISPEEATKEILADAEFEMKCKDILIQGQQAVLQMMNEALNEKKLIGWQQSKEKIDAFVNTLNLWDSAGRSEDFTGDFVFQVLNRCKTVPEAATALGMSEPEFVRKVYADPKLAAWMIQNGYQI